MHRYKYRTGAPHLRLAPLLGGCVRLSHVVAAEGLRDRGARGHLHQINTATVRTPYAKCISASR